MKTKGLFSFFVILCVFALVAAGVAAEKSAPANGELRGLWVDGFHPGIKTPQEAEELVAAAKAANFNALMIQVRRRGDALYNKSIEPFAEDVERIPGFDPLANIIEVAHRNGIEVHAWMNASPIWRDAPPPKDASHAFNQHGPNATGRDMWLTGSQAGNFKFPVGYFLDPGNPAAADYEARIYANLVKNYNVDGIHFDYIRYPETEGKSLPRGSDVGYNPTSIERFRRATGRTDVPAPDDEQFIEWRREQVTNLVRRVYLEAKAVNPKIKVTGAVIAWGKPPVSEADFENVAPMQRIFQNWHGWLQEGILDMAIPMNYASESNPQVREWFNGWIDWEKQHRHGRRIAVGVGAYLNSKEEVLAQVSRVRQISNKNGADGVCFFSYSNMWRSPRPVGANAQTAAATPPPAAPQPLDRVNYLVAKTGGSAAFAKAAASPSMPWITSPKTGYILGTAKSADGTASDGGTVRIHKKSWFGATRRVKTDGNGYFGATNLKPGKYSVAFEKNGKTLKSATVAVAAGQVAQTNVVAE